jgi:hypothetical protein
MNTGHEKKPFVSKDTMLPLGLVISICTGVVWISTQLNTIDYKLDTLEEKLEDQWTRRDMENWGLRLKMENPQIVLPDPIQD